MAAEDLESIADAEDAGELRREVRGGDRQLGWARVRSITSLALLAAIMGLLVLNLLAVRSLTTETKRAACYERLAFLGRPENPSLAAGASRLCQGKAPLVQYSEE